MVSPTFSKILRVQLTFLLLIVVLASVSAIDPTGGSVTPIKSGTAPADAPASIPAQAGNVTELNIFGYTTTHSWQGYYGNVTGTLQLADASDNVMYNWTLASPQGEIYASTNATIQWSNVQCFNFTAKGSYIGAESAGATNLYGTNLSQLETLFGITFDDVDGVDETFTLLGTNTHDLFYTAHQQFSPGECRSTRTYSNAGLGEDNKFEEVILYEPMTSSVIFTSLLDEDVLGFDQRPHDFEMLVLEDGHGTNTASTTYYFFVELE